jgi:hypothetical protein
MQFKNVTRMGGSDHYDNQLKLDMGISDLM